MAKAILNALLLAAQGFLVAGISLKPKNVEQHSNNDGTVVAANVQAVKDQVAVIADKLQEVQKTDESELSDMKKDFERQLQQKANVNAALQRENKLAAAKLGEWDQSNKDLQKKSQEIMADIKRLTDKLDSIRANMSVAGEFMDNALNETKQDSPELQVLKDLAQQEAEMAKQSWKEARMLEVAGLSSQPRVAMLQHRRHDGEGLPSFEGLLSGLSDRFHQMEQAKATTKAGLQAAFDSSLKEAEDQHQELVAKGEELKQAVEERHELNDKLRVAVEHLKEHRSYLVQKGQAIHNFASKLADISAIGKDH